VTPYGVRTLSLRAKSVQALIHANTSLIVPAHDLRAKRASEVKPLDSHWRGPVFSGNFCHKVMEEFRRGSVY
jgi:hypothetical protein